MHTALAFINVHGCLDLLARARRYSELEANGKVVRGRLLRLLAPCRIKLLSELNSGFLCAIYLLARVILFLVAFNTCPV